MDQIEEVLNKDGLDYKMKGWITSLQLFFSVVGRLKNERRIRLKEKKSELAN